MLDSIVRWYFRLPDHPAKLRFERALARTVVPGEGLVARVGGDLEMVLHPRDAIEALLLRGSQYEPSTLEFLSLNLQEGDGALLAGVNFGLHVARAARAVGVDGIVVGVEPQPAALLRAKRNLQLNGLADRVKLVGAALGRAPGLAHAAWSREENPGAASLLDRSAGFVTPVLRLADLAALLAGRPFRLALLDVQGWEREVLLGADPGAGPEIWVVELDPEFLRRSGVAGEEIVGILSETGYRLHDIHGAMPEDLLDLPERNLVAVRPGASVTWSPR